MGRGEDAWVARPLLALSLSQFVHCVRCDPSPLQAPWASCSRSPGSARMHRKAAAPSPDRCPGPRLHLTSPSHCTPGRCALRHSPAARGSGDGGSSSSNIRTTGGSGRGFKGRTMASCGRRAPRSPRSSPGALRAGLPRPAPPNPASRPPARRTHSPHQGPGRRPPTPKRASTPRASSAGPRDGGGGGGG